MIKSPNLQPNYLDSSSPCPSIQLEDEEETFVSRTLTRTTLAIHLNHFIIEFLTVLTSWPEMWPTKEEVHKSILLWDRYRLFCADFFCCCCRRLRRRRVVMFQVIKIVLSNHSPTNQPACICVCVFVAQAAKVDVSCFDFRAPLINIQAKDVQDSQWMNGAPFPSNNFAIPSRQRAPIVFSTYFE